MNIVYAIFMVCIPFFLGMSIGHKTDMTEYRNAGDYSVTYFVFSVALIVFFILLHNV